MNKSKPVRELILQLLSDDALHSTTEITEYVMSHIPDITDIDTTIRNVLFSLKNRDNSIINPKKGWYQIRKETPVSIDILDLSPLQKAIDVITDTISIYTDFNWYDCSDEELAIARKKRQMLKDLLKIMQLKL